MSRISHKKNDFRRVTITIPNDLAEMLREYQAKELLEDPHCSSFSKVIAGLLEEALVTKYEKPYYLMNY